MASDGTYIYILGGNDFNYNQNQDRGPVNALAFAYSAFPFVYPDIVGGTFGEQRFSAERTLRMETYMMRNAQWAASRNKVTILTWRISRVLSRASPFGCRPNIPPSIRLAASKVEARK